MSYESQNEFFPEFGKDDENRKKKLKNTASSSIIVNNIFTKKNIIIAISIMLGLIFAFAYGVNQGEKAVVDKLVSYGVVDNNSQKAPAKEAPAIKEQVKAEAVTPEPKKELAEDSKKGLEKQQIKDSKPYTIQIIAYKTEKTALKKVEELKKRGETPLILKSTNWYKVCCRLIC